MATTEYCEELHAMRTRHLKVRTPGGLSPHMVLAAKGHYGNHNNANLKIVIKVLIAELTLTPHEFVTERNIVQVLGRAVGDYADYLPDPVDALLRVMEKAHDTLLPTDTISGLLGILATMRVTNQNGVTIVRMSEADPKLRQKVSDYFEAMRLGETPKPVGR